MAGSRSPFKKLQNFENGVKYSKDCGSGTSSSGSNCKGKEGFLARKMAANLWETNGSHSSGNGGRVKEEKFKEIREGERGKNSPEHHFLLDQLPHSPVFEKIDGSKVGGRRRRSFATSQKLKISDHVSGFHTKGKTSCIEVARHHTHGEYNRRVKTQLKDVNYSIMASKELVKVLYRIISQEEKNSSRITLVSVLKVELDRARLQLHQLIQKHRFSCDEVDALLHQFSEEKAAWKSKEKERIKIAARELEIERKLRRQTERLNKKLGIELADTRTNLSNVMKELSVERKAREILEQTCNELARGIGEERVEVEELKKESEKVLEEVERERHMLQLADVLREERVQMKLAEARYEYEEKNAAFERLKRELESFLKNGDQEEDGSFDFKKRLEFKDFVSEFQPGLLQNGEEEPSEGEGEVDDDDSELHSIELKWSIGCDGNSQSESRRASVDEVFKGRKSLSEKIQWESICLHKKTSDHSAEFKECRDNVEIKDKDEGFKRFKIVKSQRLQSCQESGSPSVSTGRSSSRLREACSAVLQDLASRREQFDVGNQG